MYIDEIVEQDIPEVVKVWEQIKDLKERGHGELKIIVRDSTIVNVQKTYNWLHKGKGFDRSAF